MRGLTLTCCVGALLLLAVPTAAPAQDPGAGAGQEADGSSSVMLVMDASGSMRGGDGQGGTKLEAAKQALTGVVNSVPPQAQVGLRVYGGRIGAADKRRGCEDTRLIFPVSRLDREAAKEKIQGYEAKGYTPIALSLRQAANDLPATGNRTIVLISDGEDTCAPPAPCDVAREVAAKGVTLRIQTVGFRVNPAARRELECIARVANGVYRDAEDADALQSELEAISTRAVRTYVPRGVRAVGGPTVGRARRVEPGQYVDSILPDQTKWYAIDLARGETLQAAATLVPPRRKGIGAIGASLEVQIANPNYEEQTASGASATESNLFVSERGTVASAGVFGQPVGVGEQTGEFERTDEFGEPGTYYLRVALDDSGDKELFDEANGRPFAVELLVDVLGRKAEDRRPPSASGPAGEVGDSGRAGSTLVLVLVAVGLGFVGLAAGAAIGAARRKEQGA